MAHGQLVAMTNVEAQGCCQYTTQGRQQCARPLNFIHSNISCQIRPQQHEFETSNYVNAELVKRHTSESISNPFDAQDFAKQSTRSSEA